MSYKRASILFLPRVYEKDLVLDDSIFDKKFVEGMGGSGYTQKSEGKEDADVLSVIYHKLPVVYTEKEWIVSTNLHCWNCDLQFTAPPVFVPADVRINQNGVQEFEVYGNFCTFNCAQAYIEDKFGGQQRDDRTRLLKMLYKSMVGKRIEIIKPSPSKTRMEKYCGSPNGEKPEEYKEKIVDMNKEYELGVYKMDQLGRV